MMRGGGGRLVYIASLAGRIANPNDSGYATRDGHDITTVLEPDPSLPLG